MPDVAYVNGRFVPLNDACLPINDRAFYYADAVYEACTTFGGKVFLLEEHIERLERSLAGVRIDYRVDRRFLADLFEEGIRRSGYDEVLIYMQISRGAALRDKDFPKDAEPSLMATFRERPAIEPQQRECGIEATLVPDDRWGHCNYKTTMLLPNVLAHQKAHDCGKDDAIFFDRQTNRIHEATSANVFIVQERGIATPPEGPKILSGTVRRYVLQLARQNDIAAEERDVSVDELRGADEVFLTGTTTEVLGVVRVDDLVIGEGVPGPITRCLTRRFDESVGRPPLPDD